MSLPQIQRLPASEYGALEKVAEGYRPDPDHSIVIVAKQDGEIVGRTMLIRPFHIEGTWLDGRVRHGTTGLRMFRFLEAEAKKYGIGRLFAYAEDPKVEDYMGRLGYTRAPLSVWMKDI